MNYGVDWTEPIPDSDDSEQVHVPEVDRPVSISDDELEHLRQLYTLFPVTTMLLTCILIC